MDDDLQTAVGSCHMMDGRRGNTSPPSPQSPTWTPPSPPRLPTCGGIDWGGWLPRVLIAEAAGRQLTDGCLRVSDAEPPIRAWRHVATGKDDNARTHSRWPGLREDGRACGRRRPSRFLSGEDRRRALPHLSC